MEKNMMRIGNIKLKKYDNWQYHEGCRFICARYGKTYWKLSHDRKRITNLYHSATIIGCALQLLKKVIFHGKELWTW